MKEESNLSKSDLEFIINELKQTQQETASTLAVQPARPMNLFQKVQLVKSWFWPFLIGTILGLVILAGTGYLQKKETFNSISVVESVQKLATLATAQTHMTTYFSEEDNKLFGKNIPFDLPVPGSKRTLFLVVPGEVIAGVDLKNLTKKDITLDTSSKEIHITLPHATIVQASTDSKNIIAVSKEGLFRSEPDGKEWFKQEDLAKQKMIKDAKETGLLKKAEDHARIALQDFYKLQDYTVTVTFK